ncbi:MAG: transposase [Micropruina sp.]|uniref:transposase n=1 Tax=Micropruina sp. TaxID=2737536 RepID=UPI0039E46ABE
MPRHARQLAESGIYHAMLRGLNRDAIFLDDEDYARFLHALTLARDASGSAVLAYCLMPNHVHLVVRTAREPIGTTMKRLGVSYASWFNHKYERVGHLFQDRFRSRPVENDEYFVTLLRYVWNNPVAAGLSQRAEEYRWSSRRLLGRRTQLVDAEELARLLPDGATSDLSENPATPPSDPFQEGRQRCTQDAVDQLLRSVCGAESPDEFLDFAASTRRRAVGELRTRGISYAQIARATGMSIYGVKRLHATSAG